MATSIRLTPETEQQFDCLVSQIGRRKAFDLREMVGHDLASSDRQADGSVHCRIHDRAGYGAG